MLEINYGIIATVAAAAVARCYLKFVRGVEPRSVNMKGKVCVCVCVCPGSRATHIRHTS